jgi:uncharacterized membrane protein
MLCNCIVFLVIFWIVIHYNLTFLTYSVGSLGYISLSVSISLELCCMKVRVINIYLVIWILFVANFAVAVSSFVGL